MRVPTVMELLEAFLEGAGDKLVGTRQFRRFKSGETPLFRERRLVKKRKTSVSTSSVIEPQPRAGRALFNRLCDRMYESGFVDEKFIDVELLRESVTCWATAWGWTPPLESDSALPAAYALYAIGLRAGAYAALAGEDRIRLLNLDRRRWPRSLAGDPTLSQEDAAEELDVDPVSLRRWESGKVWPTPDRLGRLARKAARLLGVRERDIRWSLALLRIRATLVDGFGEELVGDAWDRMLCVVDCVREVLGGSPDVARHALYYWQSPDEPYVIGTDAFLREIVRRRPLDQLLAFRLNNWARLARSGRLGPKPSARIE